jgi:hypothetical protein
MSLSPMPVEWPPLLVSHGENPNLAVAHGVHQGLGESEQHLPPDAPPQERGAFWELNDSFEGGLHVIEEGHAEARALAFVKARRFG